MNFDVFKQQVDQQRREALKRISATPISALVWGPDPNGSSQTAVCRKLLKEELTKHTVYACFSEDLFDPHAQLSNRAQQFAQVEAFDIVFSIPDSPGSIAEIHDYSLIPSISPKIVTFLDHQWNGGYANQSLVHLNPINSPQIRFYDQAQLPAVIVEESLNIIRTLKESFYLLGRR
jgi:hypothetical protein